ncbi:hypothetical protein ET445_11280 [Agromyces protaetiae]|uniref:DUF6993 domain-containing protein n=1 Tax=Agromyces protaetiae TaxID=2509455 RepID=A0A4P6FC15_9MICO|nr:hypothetical protein [Agromyces protaetiae]QAY73840.1 hypothetical protein ET445_11280 [Agromyces protaetiae]
MSLPHRKTTAPVIAGAVLVTALLSGCSLFASEPDDGGRPTPSTSQTPSPVGPTEAPAPTLRPELSADENLAFFDFVNTATLAADPSGAGRSFIDGLVAAGFDKSAMQVTSDLTTRDTPADSIQFSVLFQGECLIGQYGPASGGYHGAVRPALGTGGCLIGSTRPIDW